MFAALSLSIPLWIDVSEEAQAPHFMFTIVLSEALHLKEACSVY